MPSRNATDLHPSLDSRSAIPSRPSRLARRTRQVHRGLGLSLSLPILASLLVAHPANAEPLCADHDPERNVFWGDLHIHTAYSMDAYIFETRLTPDDAYRFAKGETRMLPPLDENGRGTRPFRIGRPLDFAAVTDHADAFGGVRLCTDPESPAFASDLCTKYRRPFLPKSVEEGTKDITGRVGSLTSATLCGEDGSRCRKAAIDTWQDLQAAAARHNDTSPSCEFTTFVAYEHTATPKLTKIHRNIIFRNDHVIDKPITFSEKPTGIELWQELDRQCFAGMPGCDVIAIPHNPNLSNGHLFTIEYPEGSSIAEQTRLAKLRHRLEPVVEMMQIKGESECKDNAWRVLGADEDCGFEKFRSLQGADDCRGKTEFGALAGRGCSSRLDYARYALIEGLREADRLGVNPHAFGLIGATDIHTGTPGPTEEWETETFDARVPGPGYNLGGLAAVWAEENTRESIFQALRRREVYATSGSRMTVRLFGGWGFEGDPCAGDDLVGQGYAQGVPMGGDLPPRGKKGGAPSFVVSAMQDPGTAEHPGNPLQRIQIVKGWSDPDGTFHQQVVDIAGSRDNGARVDTNTCETSGPAERQLCATWTDPDFDPDRRAVYYARVFENPSCRFTTRICNAARAGEKPASCNDPTVPKTIQDRAWTSPVWYAPE